LQHIEVQEHAHMHVPLSALRRPSARCALKAKWRYQTAQQMQGAPLHTWHFNLDMEVVRSTKAHALHGQTRLVGTFAENNVLNSMLYDLTVGFSKRYYFLLCALVVAATTRNR